MNERAMNRNRQAAFAGDKPKDDFANSNRGGHLKRQPTEVELKSERRAMSDGESKMANRICGRKP